VTTTQRAVLEILNRGGYQGNHNIEHSLSRGLWLTRYDMRRGKDRLVRRLSRAMVLSLIRSHWVSGHSELLNSDGQILGITPQGRRALETP
jgi:hypothetical protein